MKFFMILLSRETPNFLLSYLIKIFSCEGKGKNIVRKNLRSIKRIEKAHDGYRLPIFAIYPMQFKGFWKGNYLCKTKRFLYTDTKSPSFAYLCCLLGILLDVLKRTPASIPRRRLDLLLNATWYESL
jgi:hypothetical protein